MTPVISARSMGGALSLAALSALGVLAALSALGPNWAAYAPATCTATHCFCELPRTGALVLQPANSWSSFGYVLIGFVMIIIAGAPNGLGLQEENGGGASPLRSRAKRLYASRRCAPLRACRPSAWTAAMNSAVAMPNIIRPFAAWIGASMRVSPVSTKSP